jgi:ATP-dependent RNA helicase MSS116
MLALATIRRSPFVKTLINITMDAKKSTRKHPYRGKKHITTNAFPRNATAPPSGIPPRVATPPLTEAVPLDTPRFADLGKENLLHPVILKTIIDDLKFDHMMPVQAATLHDLLANRVDCLAQAKTGTGKTIAFLLPAIQTMINKRRSQDSGISLLVISPTRELAMQIAKEAKQLLQNLPQFNKVSFAIGGTNKDREERDILNDCKILIATPGRLNDHLSNEFVVDRFRNLDTLVLDEADRLLDMGFMNALKDIIKCLPNKEATQRQGMLFSATIAPHVEKVAHLVLGKGYKFISTIKEGDLNTHERVPQHLVVVPTFSDVAAAMVGALRSECAIEGASSFKAIVFAPTAALVDLYGEILEQIPGLPKVSVLHSRVSQSKRTNATNAFREADNGVLVATDVVARGMDFPRVTNVFQVGVPQDKESYVHRLGRTARAGAEGRGTFIITEHETFFSQWTLKEIAFEPAQADLTAKDMVLDIASKRENNAKTYQGWLGYYKNYLKQLGWDNVRLVAEGNKFAFEGLGVPEIPGIPKSTIGKMGLRGTKGLIAIPDPPRVPRGGGGGGGGGRPSAKAAAGGQAGQSAASDAEPAPRMGGRRGGGGAGRGPGRKEPSRW